MGRMMSADDWAAYRRRAGEPLWPPTNRVTTNLPCPDCGSALLKAVSTTLYPCEGCGMGWYPVDLFTSRRAASPTEDSP